MSGFSAHWLSLREPVDARARSRTLLNSLPGRFSAIIDIGAGTGSNFRWLAPQFDPGQQWTLIDNDPMLLSSVRKANQNWATNAGYQTSDGGSVIGFRGRGFECVLNTRELDLNRNLSDLEFPADCLLTASALLDLVSRRWLTELIAQVAASGTCVLWSLSYDGLIGIDPPMEIDATIISLLNRHQLSDKGFGPALGPDAWRVACDLLEQAGLSVEVMDSSWHCGEQDRALLHELIKGWVEAATAIAPLKAVEIRQWCTARLGQIEQGQLRVSVGHRDIAAGPGDRMRGRRL